MDKNEREIIPESNNERDSQTKLKLLFLSFGISMLAYIILFHPFYLLLYPLSTVDPYLYYSYSPGFWAVDISFWTFTPLYYLWFRRAGETIPLALFYSLLLDGSASGMFLTFFCIVYEINFLIYPYYLYGFILSLLFFVPSMDMKFSKKNLLFFSGFIIAGLIWRFSGAGNVGYFISSSVVIDLFMIFYCYLFIYSFKNEKREKGKKVIS